MSGAVRSLMTGLIDYAGLFPPAGLAMEPAVRAYAAHRCSADRWMLGRFVVPAARLEEFEAAFARLAPEERGEGPWELSALLDAGLGVQAVLATAFNVRNRGDAAVRSVEVRVDGVAQIQTVRTNVPTSFELFYEVPLRGDLRWLLAAVRSMGGKAKVRTGSVTAAEIPAPDAVLKFLEGCAAIRLPFKATAGLHHAVRGEQALTYEAGSPRAPLFGFLNVLLASAALWGRRPRAEALRLLEATDAGALTVGDGAVTWGATRFSADELAATRRDLVVSVGSCSFDEPVGELRALGAPLGAAAD